MNDTLWRLAAIPVVGAWLAALATWRWMSDDAWLAAAVARRALDGNGLKLAEDYAEVWHSLAAVGLSLGAGAVGMDPDIALHGAAALAGLVLLGAVHRAVDRVHGAKRALLAVVFMVVVPGFTLGVLGYPWTALEALLAFLFWRALEQPRYTTAQAVLAPALFLATATGPIWAIALLVARPQRTAMFATLGAALVLFGVRAAYFGSLIPTLPGPELADVRWAVVPALLASLIGSHLGFAGVWISALAGAPFAIVTPLPFIAHTVGGASPTRLGAGGLALVLCALTAIVGPEQRLWREEVVHVRRAIRVSQALNGTVAPEESLVTPTPGVHGALTPSRILDRSGRTREGPVSAESFAPEADILHAGMAEGRDRDSVARRLAYFELDGDLFETYQPELHTTPFGPLVLVRKAPPDTDPRNEWRRLYGKKSKGKRRQPPTAEEEIEALEAIGYLSGVIEAEEDAPVSVITHDPTQAWAGRNFYVGGHGPEATLTDMDGTVLHTWRLPFDEAFPDRPPGKRSADSRHWRKAWPLDDGGVLALFEGVGILAVNRDSELLWAQDNGAHHDLWVDPDGTIWVLTRKARFDREIHPSRPVLEDWVTVLAADGTEQRRFSVLAALRDSPHSHLLQRAKKRYGDLMHTNALVRTDASDPLGPGMLLLSSRALSALFAIDPDSERVIWSLTGDFRAQHDPTRMADGSLLFFDNLGAKPRARVLQVDPEGELVWQHDPGDLLSKCCGTTQRLANGNTLITVSEQGRAIEVTPSGEVVWDFRNPHRAAHDPTLVASLFELTRLPPDYGAGWLTAP